MRALGLAVAGMGFGSALTLLFTKSAFLSLLGKFLVVVFH
jgi:hypothetical protein